MNKRSYNDVQMSNDIDQMNINVDNMDIVDSDQCEQCDQYSISLNKKVVLESASSDEWPIYQHPQGGWVKFTPWGSVRMTINDQGETVSKFEDVSFHDTTFDLPSTPILNKSPIPTNDDDLVCEYGMEHENYFGM
jgi:hypothetical protein